MERLLRNERRSLGRTRNGSQRLPGVWKQIAATLTQWAARTGLEKGRKVRIDATPISCSIRHPTDNQLLYDAVRVLTRLLAVLSAKADFAWTDHTRRAKKRHMKPPAHQPHLKLLIRT